MISFVTFYIDVTARTMDNIHRRTSTITVTEPHEYIRTMFASARRFHSACRQVILSDRRTIFPSHPDTDIIRYDLDARNPMMARSIAWLDYLKEAGDHTIFLDSDILINGDLSSVFDCDFDVSLTYRDEDKWPINAGVNFAHGGRLEGAAHFHRRWLGRFRGQHHRGSVWGGDQDALREIFSAVDFARDDIFCHDLDDTKVLFLPCSTYNFSTSIKCEMDGHYPEKKVLHFKGRRKPHLFPYWRTYIQPAATQKG
ncbi:MAG: hypothetical protein OXG39_13530 [Chloroflexi bacterium]|nr:hypothetical protein [Chloroflexota bacterium]